MVLLTLGLTLAHTVLVASLSFPAQAGSGTADGASMSPQQVFD